jgi:hypothetical protein
MKYMVIHPLPKGTTLSDIEKLAESAQTDARILGYRSFLNLSEGRGVCILEAPDRQSVVDWLTKNKLPFEAVLDVELEGYRGEFIEKNIPAAAATE